MASAPVPVKDQEESTSRFRLRPSLLDFSSSGQLVVLSTAAVASRSIASTHTAKLFKKFGEYCEAMFIELASVAPSELSELVSEGRLPASRLTYAAEALGRAQDAALVMRSLLPLLRHPAPIVREGAIIGLGRHLTPVVRARLAEVAQQDPSAAVRRAALDELGD